MTACVKAAVLHARRHSTRLLFPGRFAVQQIQHFPCRKNKRFLRKVLEVTGNQISAVISLLNNNLIKWQILHVGQDHAGRRGLNQQAKFGHSIKQMVYYVWRKAEFLSPQNLPVFYQNGSAVDRCDFFSFLFAFVLHVLSGINICIYNTIILRKIH